MSTLHYLRLLTQSLCFRSLSCKMGQKMEANICKCLGRRWAHIVGNGWNGAQWEQSALGGRTILLLILFRIANIRWSEKADSTFGFIIKKKILCRQRNPLLPASEIDSPIASSSSLYTTRYIVNTTIMFARIIVIVAVWKATQGFSRRTRVGEARWASWQRKQHMRKQVGKNSMFIQTISEYLNQEENWAVPSIAAPSLERRVDRH